MKRGITVIKMRGSWHDKEIREFNIDNDGVHIGEVFKDVENIMIGSPRSLLQAERDQMAAVLGKKQR
jgi:circadian clock protein KaiC